LPRSVASEKDADIPKDCGIRSDDSDDSERSDAGNSKGSDGPNASEEGNSTGRVSMEEGIRSDDSDDSERSDAGNSKGSDGPNASEAVNEDGSDSSDGSDGSDDSSDDPSPLAALTDEFVRLGVEKTDEEVLHWVNVMLDRTVNTKCSNSKCRQPGVKRDTMLKCPGKCTAMYQECELQGLDKINEYLVLRGTAVFTTTVPLHPYQVIMKLHGHVTPAVVVNAWADNDKRLNFAVELTAGNFVVPFLSMNRPIRTNLAAYVKSTTGAHNVDFVEDDFSGLWLTVGASIIPVGAKLLLEGDGDTKDADPSFG
jgi:hypothetical protein